MVCGDSFIHVLFPLSHLWLLKWPNLQHVGLVQDHIWLKGASGEYFLYHKDSFVTFLL